MTEFIITCDSELKPDGSYDVKRFRELVRCKDCKHRYDNDKKCPYCNECGGREYPPDDWFCADGERKTDY